VSRPSYPNWQRKRIQNPSSVSSNLTEGTEKVQLDSLRHFTKASLVPQSYGSARQSGPSCGIQRFRNIRQVVRHQMSVQVQRHNGASVP
jgi:hypothetical protein